MGSTVIGPVAILVLCSTMSLEPSDRTPEPLRNGGRTRTCASLFRLVAFGNLKKSKPLRLGTVYISSRFWCVRSLCGKAPSITRARLCARSLSQATRVIDVNRSGKTRGFFSLSQKEKALPAPTRFRNEGAGGSCLLSLAEKHTVFDSLGERHRVLVRMLGQVSMPIIQCAERYGGWRKVDLMLWEAFSG